MKRDRLSRLRRETLSVVLPTVVHPTARRFSKEDHAEAHPQASASGAGQHLGRRTCNRHDTLRKKTTLKSPSGPAPAQCIKQKFDLTLNNNIQNKLGMMGSLPQYSPPPTSANIATPPIVSSACILFHPFSISFASSIRLLGALSTADADVDDRRQAPASSARTRRLSPPL